MMTKPVAQLALRKTLQLYAVSVKLGKGKVTTTTKLVLISVSDGRRQTTHNNNTKKTANAEWNRKKILLTISLITRRMSRRRKIILKTTRFILSIFFFILFFIPDWILRSWILPMANGSPMALFAFAVKNGSTENRWPVCAQQTDDCSSIGPTSCDAFRLHHVHGENIVSFSAISANSVSNPTHKTIWIRVLRS